MKVVIKIIFLFNCVSYLFLSYVATLFTFKTLNLAALRFPGEGGQITHISLYCLHRGDFNNKDGSAACHCVNSFFLPVEFLTLC